MGIKEILVWLFIFVVGSLIVTAIVNPEYRTSVIDSIKDFFSEEQVTYSNEHVNSKDKVTSSDKYVNSKESVEPIKKVKTYRKGSPYMCEIVEQIEFQNAMPEPRKNICKGMCTQIQKEYYSSKCEDDWFICYCIDQDSE